MRFQVVSDPRARSTACHGLTRAAARGRTATVSALAAAACGLVLTACGSQNPPEAASSASTGSCVTAQLKTSITDTGALAGQAGGYLKFTNDSNSVCRMTGWPVVMALTATGSATRLRHVQSTMFGAWHYTSPPPVVTLRPGDSAYAVVAADDQPANVNTRCPAPYVRLRVSPPGDSANVTISAWLPGAASYLPACTSADGSPTAGTSTITTLSSLPH